MNYMKQVAEMLGVELGEIFSVKFNDTGEIERGMYFTETGLYVGKPVISEDEILSCILTDKAEIIKLPWKPKKGEMYFYIHGDGSIGLTKNDGDALDVALIAFGNCFRNKAGAQAHKDEMLAKMKEALGE